VISNDALNIIPFVNEWHGKNEIDLGAFSAHPTPLNVVATSHAQELTRLFTYDAPKWWHSSTKNTSGHLKRPERLRAPGGCTPETGMGMVVLGKYLSFAIFFLVRKQIK